MDTLIAKNEQEEQIRHYIFTIDFSDIINKLIHRHGWSRSDVEKTSGMYRKYLFLRKKYEKYVLPPSEEIDEFWHHHILETKKYREDCDVIFGYYLDHYPQKGKISDSENKTLDESFDEMRALFKKEFSEDITTARSWRTRIGISLRELLK